MESNAGSGRRVAGVVLAAGLGSRLDPITRNIPKPCLPIAGVSLLESAVRKLRSAGAEHVFVNTHYRAHDVEHELCRHGRPAWLTTRYEERLSGPAGALRLFADDLRSFDDVVVLSGDVTIEDDLVSLLRTFRKTEAALTFGSVVTKDAGRFGVLSVDSQRRLISAREKPNVDPEMEHEISAGVYCISPSVCADLPDRQIDFVADVVPIAERRNGVTVAALSGSWSDIGTLPSYHAAVMHRLDTAGHLDKLYVASSSSVAPTAVLRGCVAAEAGAFIGSGAWVEDSVVLPGAVIEDGTVVYGAVVAKNKEYR